MKRLVLPVALVLVLVLAGLAWMLVRAPRSAPAPASAERAAAAQPALPARVEAPAEELGSAAEASVDDARGSRAERAAADQGAQALERASWIEGRVVAPAGCALAEGLEVVAFREAREGLALVQGLGLRGRGVRTAIEAEMEDEPEAAAHAASDQVLRRAPVAADGAFRLPRLEGETTLHLAVHGGTLVSRATSAVALDDEAPVLLRPGCGGSLLVRLRRPADADASAALAGIEVVLETAFEGLSGAPQTMRTERRTARSDEQGEVWLAGLPAEVPFTLVLSSERWAWSKQAVAALAPGEARELDLVLEEGARVLGRVVDEDGAPLGGASVRASKQGRWFGFDDPLVRTAVTGADGRFELVHVASGTVKVLADAPERLASEPQAIELAPAGTHEGLEIRLTRGASIRGHVRRPDGSPADGASVAVTFDLSAMGGMGAFNMRRGARGAATSGPDGAFAVHGLGAGPFTVRAEARAPGEGEGAPPGQRVRVDGVRPGTEGLELVLLEPLGLVGRVTDPAGLPVTEFTLELQEQGEGMFATLGREEREQRVEDDEGRFEFADLGPGRWKAYARAKGFAIPEGVEIVLPRAEELVLVLEPECVVEGVVQAPTGEPVVGAKVLEAASGPAWQRALAGGMPPPEATTGPGGRFRLEGLRAGPSSLVAEHAEWCASEPLALELAPGEARDELVIALRQGARLEGEVRLGDEPGRGVFVQATQLSDFDQRMATTGADGTFAFSHLRPGSWQVVALPGGFGASAGGGDEAEDALENMGEMLKDMKLVAAELVDGETTHVVLGGEGAGKPVRVKGRVTHDGEPYSKAMITFFPAGKDAAQSARYGTTREDGGYELELVRAGSYTINVQRIGATGSQQQVVEFSRDVPEVEEEVIDLEIPTGRVSGRVEGPDGEPLDGVRISLHPSGALEAGTLFGGQYAEALSEDGRFDLQGLRPGRYELFAGGMAVMNLGGPARYGRVARTVELSEGEWMRDLELELPAPATLAVQVVDAAGKPAREAMVFVRDAAGRVLDRLSFTATDAGGKARYEGLAPGSYTVLVRDAARACRESAPVRLAEGESGAVEVRLEAGTILLVTLLGDEDQELEARFSVRDEDEREVGGLLSLSDLMKTFGQGFSKTEQRIGPLPPGRYVVRATLSDGRSVKKPVTLSGQAERKVTLRLD